MSESLKNDRWSSGSVHYSFSISIGMVKNEYPIVYFTLWHNPRLKNCHIPILRIIFLPCFDICELIYYHFNAKTLLFTFLWLEYRFKSFLELHVHFKGFICIRMRKLHEERQIPADAHEWCQIVFSFNVPKVVSKYLTTKQLSQICRWSVRTLAQYTCSVIFSRQQ